MVCITVRVPPRYGIPASFVWLAAVLSATVLCDRAGAQLKGEAYSGEPFGVGRLTIQLSKEDSGTVDFNGFELVEKHGRIFYPSFTTGDVLGIVLSILGADSDAAPSSVTAYYLFTGEAPLELTWHTPTTHTTTITPRLRPERQRDFMRHWWDRYQASAREQYRLGDYPPILETYLTSMLSGRLHLDRKRIDDRGRTASPLGSFLDGLLGTEALRLAMIEDTVRGSHDPAGSADLPLPSAVNMPSPSFPQTAEDPLIEPIAMRVPEECFYIRFGKFSNYMWLAHLLEDYGGDLKGMITLRGHNARLNDRMQRQLGLKETVLAKLIGDKVVSDVALIGRDAYLFQGAAVGILLEQQHLLLGAEIANQRANALQQEKENGGRHETIKIADHEVSLISTPDNRLRSFYAVDGKYHLVTTSRTIVRRFFEAGGGQRSLGYSQEFRHARSIMPVEREDTVFAYLSTAFFRGLISPQYRIESRRRMRSVSDIEVLEIARLAARAEGLAGSNLDELVEAGLLPERFGQRADGSRLVEQDNRLLDSMRGARGSFLPVADATLAAVTDREARDYRTLAEFCRQHWQHMDPIMVGVKRIGLGADRMECVEIDARAVPFEKEKYGFLTAILGPPLRKFVRPSNDDLLHAQVVVNGFGGRSDIGVHHLFVGVQDMEPSVALQPNKFLKWLQWVFATPGYLGTWPSSGWLGLLPVEFGSEPDVDGYSRLPLGIWRRQFDRFSVLSMRRDLLEHRTETMEMSEAENEAQLRIRVGDLSETKGKTMVDWVGYSRSWQASLGNVRFLNALSQQLKLPRADSRLAAERILDAELVCSLGGDYQLARHASGFQQWTSTKWPGGPIRRLPAEYQSPLSQWMRGLDAALVLRDDKLLMRLRMDMQRKPTQKLIGLPAFNRSKDGAQGNSSGAD